jgi:hypothetical protein
MIARAKVYGIKKSMSNTVGPKYSSSLNENPIGSFILIKPEKMNNDPTKILKILTKVFILFV